VTVLVTIEAVVLALLAVLVVGLLRSHAEILRRLHQLGAGSDGDDSTGSPAAGRAGAVEAGGHDFRVMPQMPSPPDRTGFPVAADLSGPGVADDAVTVRVTGVDHDTVVAFLSSGCVTCRRFWDTFAGAAALDLPPGHRLVVVTRDPAEESVSAIAELAPSRFPVVMSSRAWADYDVPGAPYFVVVHGPTGAVRGEGTGPDWEQVVGLLGQAAGDAAAAAGLDAGRVRKPRSDAAREARVDQELLGAGVRPGDPSLYPPAGSAGGPDAGPPDPGP
jgi:hypothetical protein